MAQYFPEVLITSLSCRFVMIHVVSSSRGSSVPYFPDRSVLFYYTNRDLGDRSQGNRHSRCLSAELNNEMT